MIVKKIIQKETINIIKWFLQISKPYVGLLLSLTVISSIMSVFGVTLAIVSKRVVDIATGESQESMISSIVLFAILILSQISFNAIHSLLSVHSGEKITYDLRLKLFQQVSKAKWLQVNQYHSGDLLTRMTNDISTITNGFVVIFPQIISLGVRLITAFITLLFLQPKIAMIAIFIAPVTILLSKKFSKKLGSIQKSLQETESKYRSFMQEGIQNNQVHKVFGLEEYSLNEMNTIRSQRRYLIKKKNKLSILTNTSLTLGYWTSYFITFSIGSLGLLNGSVSFGTLTAIIQLISQIQSPFMGLASSLPKIISIGVSVERIMEVESMQLEPEKRSLGVWDQAHVIFDRVSYGYDSERKILNHISCKIRPCEIVGIVGSSGVGKTTMFRLLLGLIEAREGKVYIAKGQYRERASVSTRNLISYVPQGSTLFSGTIADNIRLGKIEATEAEIIEAAKQACAWEFIKELPNGINTKIGELGNGLSQGQTQRIALARGIIRKTPILLLDEITSALDPITEKRVLKTIRELNPPRTCIVITHRYSSLEICDKLLQLENGELFEIDSVDMMENKNKNSDTLQVI